MSLILNGDNSAFLRAESPTRTSPLLHAPDTGGIPQGSSRWAAACPAARAGTAAGDATHSYDVALQLSLYGFLWRPVRLPRSSPVSRLWSSGSKRTATTADKERAWTAFRKGLKRD